MSVLELRQYTLRPGQRDTLVELFEREFIESQEALGMKIVGTFRDLDDADRFVWLRGFKDMAARAEGLNALYSGAVWKAHSKAANATMVDVSNVHLLRPARVGSGFGTGQPPRPSVGASELPKALIVANLYYLDAPVGREFIAFFEREVTPALKAAGVTVAASYVTEASPNNFPQLPVREHDHVFVWFSTYADRASYEECLRRLERSAAWLATREALQSRLKGPPEVLRLQPTPRSELRG